MDRKCRHILALVELRLILVEIEEGLISLVREDWVLHIKVIAHGVVNRVIHVCIFIPAPSSSNLSEHLVHIRVLLTFFVIHLLSSSAFQASIVCVINSILLAFSGWRLDNYSLIKISAVTIIESITFNFKNILVFFGCFRGRHADNCLIHIILALIPLFMNFI